MPLPAQTWVTPVTLEGSRVRLEPLAERHANDLRAAAADASIFRWILGLPMEGARFDGWFNSCFPRLPVSVAQLKCEPESFLGRVN